MSENTTPATPKITITTGPNILTCALRPDGVADVGATGIFETVMLLPDGDDRKNQLEDAVRLLVEVLGL